MSRIIKHNFEENEHISELKSEYFSHVSEGEQTFQYANFSDESSVQDDIAQSMVEGTRKRKIIKPLAPIIEDEEPEATQNKFFQEVAMDDLAVSADDIHVPASQKDVLVENAKEREFEEKLQATTKQIADLNTEISRLNAKIQEVQNGIPAQIAAAKQEGIEKGKAAQLAEGERKYTAEKNDYLQTVQQSWQTAIQDIAKLQEILKNFDEQIPDVVVGFVRQLVGAERKLNDQLIVNIVKSTMARLSDLQNLSLTVNPDDVDVLQSNMPGVEVKPDVSIPRGNVKMYTKAGEVDVSIDSWISGLEKQIHEQFAATQNNTAE